MQKILGIVLAAVLVMAPASFGQRGRNGGHQTRGSNHNDNRDDHGNRNDNRGDGRPDGRNYNIQHHRRIDPVHDVRIVGEHEQILFGGFWFSCNYDWPIWVWDGDVYVVEVGPDVWEMYDYTNPSNEIAIYVVE